MRSLGNRFTLSDFHIGPPPWWSEPRVRQQRTDKDAWSVAGAILFPISLSAIIISTGAMADARFLIYTGIAMLLTSIVLALWIFADGG